MVGGVLTQVAEQLGGAFARRAPQDSVDEAVAGATATLGQLDAVGDDRVVGCATEVEQLVQAEAQGRKQGAVQALGGPVGKPPEHMIEREATLDRAIGEAHRQGTVARVKRLSLGLERMVGVGTPLEDTTDDLICTHARGRHWRFASGSSPLCATARLAGLGLPNIGVPGLGHQAAGKPWPRRNAFACMGRLPGGCTSRNSSKPSEQPSRRRSPSAYTPRCAGSSDASEARRTPSSVPSARATRAPMWGYRARTRRSSRAADFSGSSTRSSGPIFSA